MFPNGSYNSLLCGVFATATYVIYTYRYTCFYHTCVWYAHCRRKCKRNEKVRRKQDTIAFRTLDFTDNTSGHVSQQGLITASSVSSVPLFPHIKEICSSSTPENRHMTERLHQALREHKVIYHSHHKSPPAILATRKVSVYTELLRKEFATLPQTITVVLDKPLIDMLNMKLPVRSLTGDATYVLSTDSEETIVCDQ